MKALILAIVLCSFAISDLTGETASGKNFNWEAWAKKEFQSLPPVITNGSKLGKAKYLVSRTCDKMAELGIKPNNSFPDRAFTAFLTSRSKGTLADATLSADQGNCGDVARILGVVLSVLTAVEKCGARRRKIAALGVKKYQGLDNRWC